nr:MAG TPA: hypothetical protein [Caudoviricetes sp.]
MSRETQRIRWAELWKRKEMLWRREVKNCHGR